MSKPKRTVLVIDGSSNRGDSYRRQLQQDATFAYQVLTEHSSAQMLALCRLQPIDTIVLDLGFLPVSSLNFASQLKEQIGDNSPPVIVIGSNDIESVLQALRSGAVDYLVKERMTADGLRLAVQNAMTKAKLRQELQCNQQRLQISIETLLDCLGIFSSMRDCCGQIVDFRIDYLNAAACENNRMSKEMQVGRSLGEILPEHCQMGLFEDYCRVVETGDPLTKDSLIYDNSCGKQRLVRAYEIRATRLGDGLSVSWRDITERKRQEMELRETASALRQQQSRLQKLINTAPIGIGIGSASGEVIAANDAMLHLHGYTREEFEQQGMNWLDSTPPQLREKTYEAIRQLQQQGWIPPEEKELLRRDGSRIPVWISAVRWAEGVDEHVAFAVDLTKQKQAEASLQASEKRSRDLAEAMPQMVWTADAAGSVNYFNRRWYEYTGLSAAESMGWAGVSAVHREERDRTLARWCQSLAQGEPFEIEHRLRDQNGDYRWFINRGLPTRDSQGQITGWIGTITDINDQKQARQALQESQDRLNLAFEAARMGSWDWNLQTGEIDWSPQLEQLFGFSPGTFDGRHETVISRIHPGDRERVLDAIERAVEQGTDYNLEFRFLKPDGKIRWAVSRGRVFYDATGLPVRMVGIDVDITERKQAELALQEAHIQLEAALAVGSIYTWRWNLLDNLVVTDRHFAHLFGVEPERATAGLPIEQLLNAIHPEDRPPVTAAIERAIATGEDYAAEYRIRNANGEERWVIARGRVEYDPDGNAIAFPGALTDISDRKQVEQRLQASEERLQLGMQVAGFALAQFDYESNTVELSPAAAALYGLPPQELVVPRERIHATFHPEERAELLQIIEQVLAPAGAGWFAREHRVVWPNGEVKWLSVRKQVFFERSGESLKPRRAILAAIDISDRKQAEAARYESEERLRLAIKSAQLGTWDWNLTTNELTWDSGCKAMFGLSCQAEINMKIFFDGVHPDDREQVEQAIQWSCDSASGGLYEIEYRVIGVHDGIERWIAAKGQTYFAPDGSPLRMIGTVLNVTQQKQAEAQREQLLQREQAAKEEALRANRIKDEFLATLSHELRTPLNPILGWAQLLQTRQCNETIRAKALSAIIRNAQLQTQLIDDLLDIAKIVRGKLSLKTTAVDLSLVIAAAIETVRTAATAKSISLQSVLPQIGQVSGDPARIQQIVWNLLSNAIKFTPHGGRVEVRLQQVNNQAQITVSDTGKGISPDFLPHIFESFRQEDVSVARQFGGLGLGLAIVRQLVEAHGGTIAADSPGKGQGATFTVRLPLMSVPIAAAPHQLNDEQQADLRGVRVLVVDDEPDSLDLVVVILESEGAIVTAVASGQEALQHLSQFPFDVVVSDIGMPGMDGYALLQSLRSGNSPNREVSAIALTAYAREKDQQRTLEAGFQLHLAKPVDPTVLVEAISAISTVNSN